jgi:hypothetical protein
MSALDASVPGLVHGRPIVQGRERSRSVVAKRWSSSDSQKHWGETGGTPGVKE